MGRRTRVKLIIRTIILVFALFAAIIDTNLLDKIMNLNIIANIKRWIVEHKKGVIIGVLIALVIIILTFVVASVIKSNSYYGEYYITETGEKYHKKDCIFIKDKRKVERLTESDYYSGEYDPCQICLPKD